MTRTGPLDKRDRRSTGKVVIALAVFLVIAFIALTLPDHPYGFSLSAVPRLPLEIPAIGLALLLLPRRAGDILAAVVTLALGTLLFLKIADIGVQSAFQRRFNPYLDAKMLMDGWNLLSGSIGTLVAGLAVFTAIGAFLLVLWLCFRSQRHLAAAEGRSARIAVGGFGALLLLGGGLWLAGPLFGLGGIADARAVSTLEDRLTLVAQSVTDMRHFETDLAAPEAIPPKDQLFQTIRGRDVVLIFVESYGRNAVEDPRYAPLIGPRLHQVEDQLDAAGYASASGWSRSPTMGGLSWLAHGTFLSGLWVDSQARYDRLMISDRPSLNRLFQRAGWRTAAIMPAITMDWPEAAYFGYDSVFAAKDLGYRGKPFNWVTMPDQYTLHAMDRLVRHAPDGKGGPVMAEIALVSSHAPWTPVPKLIDWAEVGDGAAFNGQAVSGESPRVVWADQENVRRHYIATIDYALQTLGDYIAHFGDDALFIILGDHQPAPLVTGPEASRAVPIHVISNDIALIQRFQADGFTPGMTPAKDAAAPPMADMRDRLIRLLSPSAPAPPPDGLGVKKPRME